MKDYDKNKELPYLKYWDANNLHGWTISQNLSLGNFEWVQETSEFNEDNTKAIIMIVMKDVFLMLLFNILNLHNLHNDLPFLPERMKLEKV